jgi:parallel beta-helix repeat protein
MNMMNMKKSKIICISTVIILLLSILPLITNETINTRRPSGYQQVIDSLYDLKEDSIPPAFSDDSSLSQYRHSMVSVPQNPPQLEDFKSRYSISSETFSQFTSEAPPRPEPQLRVAFDVSHTPTVHWDAYMLEKALGSVNVEFRYLWGIYELSEDVDVLLIPSSTVDYDEFELDHISSWFGTTGDKLLWAAGDSDWGGFYPNEPNNAILERLDAHLRISADTVQDFVNNDGAPYRVAVPEPASDGVYNSIFTDGVSSAIFHGPTSVLGYQGIVVDLTENPISGVEIIMQASADAQAVDQDGTFTDFDFYSTYKPFDGSYPMMAIDSHFGDGKHVIVSGEPIFTDYKNMYGVHTELGLFGNPNPNAWNGGFQDGKILVDNIFNWFGLDPALPRYYGHGPILIESDDDFTTNDFAGYGTMEEPYSLEGYSFASRVDNLITISGTSAYFYIGDNLFDGLYSGFNAIQLFEVGNGIISNNFIRRNTFGIDVNNIYDCTFTNNVIYDNAHDAIRMWYSERITFDNNIIYNTGASGFSINTATDIIVINNKIINNQFGMHTYLFDNSFISENLFRGNFETGINLWECMNNEISNNRFFYQGYAGIGIYYSDDNTFSDNIVCGSSHGVLLETSRNNLIARNEIFETETGIALNNKAGNNFCRENILYGNNQGIFISNDPYPVVDLWPNQNIFATDSDSICWRAIWFETYSELPINDIHDNLLQVSLTVNGIPVDTSFSEVYFYREQLRFDITYLSQPLSVGDHEFVAQFVLASVIGWQPIAHVTVTQTPPVRNFIFLNTLFDNNDGIHLQNANDNIVAGNTLTNNFGVGIGVYGSCNNRIMGNQIEYSGMKGIMVTHDFGWDITSEVNTIGNNRIFGGNEDGISLEWANYNLVADNEIFDNQWAGVRLFGTSKYNDIIGNTIHDNWGGGIAFESYSDVHMRFWQDITATEADHISWQISFLNESEDQAWYEYNNMEVLLTVDNEPVGVWFSEMVYWDDGWQLYRFDVDSYLEPLPEGEHAFNVQCVLEGDLIYEYTAYVTVIPATEDDYVSHNYIAGNEIFSNEWSGINLWKTYSNHLTENQVYWHHGDGIHITDSADNIVDFNTIFENDVGIGINSADNNILANNDIFWNNWNGIHLSGTASGNTVIENIIHQNWGGGINIESYSDVFMPFYPTYILGIPIIATEADYISWHRTMFYQDEGLAWYEHDNLETLLTIDGELVDVGYSEVYWDDWTYPNWPYPWQFSIDYYSEPLSVGIHEFTVQFILEGDLVLEKTAYVTIIPATDDDYTSHNSIINNEIYENEWTGINIWRSHNNIIDTNTISSNAGQGIWIGESRSNEILNNIVVFSDADSGINLYHSYNHLVSGNTISYSYFGILLEESNGNTIVDNYVCDNDGAGIQLMGTSSDNTIIGNTIHRNAHGVFIDSYTQVQMRFGQSITATDTDFIFWQASSVSDSFEDLEAEYEVMEVLLTVDGNPVDVWFSEIYFDEGWQVYRYDMDYNSEPLAIGEHEFHVEFYIDGVLQEEWIRTPIVTVVPATDENYASHNTIVDNDIFDFNWIGISLFRSLYNYISGNTISTGLAGIRLEGSRFNIITENDAFGCINGGVMLVRSSDYNVVERNDLFGHGWSGIFVGTSNFNKIVKNNLFENGANGLYSYYSNSNEYRSNNVFANAIGIVLFGSGDSIVTRNQLTSNTETGIYLVEGSSGNSITRNTIFGSTSAGITLLGGSENQIHRNIINGGYFGIFLDSTSFSKIRRNTVIFCEIGIALESSNDNIISRNLTLGGGTGIFLSNSHRNRIQRNLVISNEIGIHLIESSDNKLFRNEFLGNDRDIVEEP